jgi:hypothetical protein
LVRDLKVLVLILLCDVGDRSSGNLIEHGLAAPASEQLAPVVRAGLLTTTDEPSLARRGA